MPYGHTPIADSIKHYTYGGERGPYPVKTVAPDVYAVTLPDGRTVVVRQSSRLSIALSQDSVPKQDTTPNV